LGKQKGFIYKIERFSLHDGPGIRTLVVMKGCPLRCLWCSSPQTQAHKPELLYISRHCRGCGKCIAVCPAAAISYDQDGLLVQTERSLCSGCGACLTACLNHAREIAGRYCTAEELFLEIEKDSPFYRRSGGGVTMGGGEAAMQADFVTQFLRICKDHHIHTVMETSAFVTWKNLEPLLSRLDLIYIDIKHMDENRHIGLTGVPNHLILANARRVAQVCPTIVRIPVIPGLNDSIDNILATARFAQELGGNLVRLELLPYHKFGMHTYDELGKTYVLKDIEPPSDDQMDKLKEIAFSAGIQVEIGG